MLVWTRRKGLHFRWQQPTGADGIAAKKVLLLLCDGRSRASRLVAAFDLGDFLVAHVPHFHGGAAIADIAPMPFAADEPFPVPAFVTNENVRLNVRSYHVNLTSQLLNS